MPTGPWTYSSSRNTAYLWHKAKTQGRWKKQIGEASSSYDDIITKEGKNAIIMAMGCVFFHIDLDAFFASVEILDNPQYKDKPLIIGTPGPRNVASTCSYEARKYGVHSAMPMTTALRLCPNAICIPGRYSRYSEKSKEVMKIIKDFAPGFLQVSIDEAFLDLTGMERIYPLPGRAAKELKRKIAEETGLTVSIGVATSRFIAKLASDYHKPDGLTIVPSGREMEFVDKVGLRKLWGVGNAMYEALERKGMQSTETIRAYTLDQLKAMMGDKSGEYLYSIVRGIDPGIYQGARKSHSISSEITFYPDVYSIDALDSCLLEMASDLSFRALSEKVIARSVTLKLRYGDFTTTTIQETPDCNLYSSDDIHKVAKRLLRVKFKGQGIRLIGLALGQLYSGEEPEQKELFSEDKEKRRALEKTILSLSRDGKKVIKAGLLKNHVNDENES